MMAKSFGPAERTEVSIGLVQISLISCAKKRGIGSANILKRKARLLSI